jgi:hypothetical protein
VAVIGPAQLRHIDCSLYFLGGRIFQSVVGLSEKLISVFGAFAL